ncbi:MAG: signal transduction protein [Pseudomonadota bacterium]
MPTTNQSLAVATVLLVAAFATHLTAQPLAAGMLRADIDGDGAVSQSEATEARRAMFSRLDGDNDGQISGRELDLARDRIAAMARMMDSMVELRSQRLDSDGDGALSEAEFTARNPMFDLVDRNGDGIASPAEIAQMRETIAAQRQ